MSKEIPEKQESPKRLADQVRERLITELERAMETYGQEWVNKENCMGLIDDLRNKRSTQIGGPLWGDFLDGVLHDLGMESRTDGKYETVWKELEEGIKGS